MASLSMSFSAMLLVPKRRRRRHSCPYCPNTPTPVIMPTAPTLAESASAAPPATRYGWRRAMSLARLHTMSVTLAGGGGGGATGASFANGGKGIEMDGGPCMVSVSTGSQRMSVTLGQPRRAQWQLLATGCVRCFRPLTQLVRDALGRLEHLARQLGKVLWNLSLDPLLELVEESGQVDHDEVATCVAAGGSACVMWLVVGFRRGRTKVLEAWD